LKGLQKEVQVPHLGMSSSAIKNLKGENENLKKNLISNQIQAHIFQKLRRTEY